MPPKNMTGLSIVGHFDATHNVVYQNNKTLNSTTYGTTYGDQFGKHISDSMYFTCISVHFRLFLLYKQICTCNNCVSYCKCKLYLACTMFEGN